MSGYIRTFISLAMPMMVGLLPIPATAQSVLYVDAKAPAGGNGWSWATAYRYLQDALTAAAPGSGVTEVRVAAGTYKPDQGQGFTPGDRDAAFNLVDHVAIRGGYAGLGNPDPDARDFKLNETILSGDLLGNDGPAFANDDENSSTVVATIGIHNGCVLDGCTITGGNGMGYGGGISIRGFSSPLLTNLIIRKNRTFNYGGGIEFNYLNIPRTRPIIAHCVIAENSAGGGAGACALGGTSPQFINCLFLANKGLYKGGGFRSYQSQASFANCVFSGNTAVFGGAIHVQEPENREEALGTTTLRNCSLVQNHTTGESGAVELLNSARADILNCIIWNNTGPGALESNQIRVTGGTLMVAYSSVQGWTGLLGGIANNGDDPLFAHLQGPDGLLGTLDDNLRLRLDSPSLDTGNNDYRPSDEADLDHDGDWTEPLPLDLDGAPRMIGDTINRGAYETTDCNANDVGDFADISAGTSGDCNNDLIPDDCQAEICPCNPPGDLDCDGDVDQSDFGRFQTCIAQPGVPQLEPACRRAHIDSDDDVDVTDLDLFIRCISGPDKPAKHDCAG